MGTLLDTVMTRTRNHYTLTNRDDNASVTVGASVTLAFVTTCTAQPADDDAAPVGLSDRDRRPHIGCLNMLRTGPRFGFRPLLNGIVRL